MAGAEKKGGRQKQREQKGGGVGSVVSDQDRTEEEEKGKRGEQWATRQDLTIPATISLTRRNPNILLRSLKNQVNPSFAFFKNLLGTDENTITAIKRFSGILIVNLDTYVVPNVNLLRENGVPESHIFGLLKQHPRLIMTNPVGFKEIVEEVKEMGFNPLKFCFVLAVFAMSGMNKSTWEKEGQCL
uniref:Uncharacterized protein n=1 Tax=Fagus sylvatica TaxID=28930 RepID=A0A2N9J1P1_FAGSY